MGRGYFDKFIEILSAPVGLDVSESNDTAIGVSESSGVPFSESAVLHLPSGDSGDKENVLSGSPSSDLADIAMVSQKLPGNFQC